MLTILLLGLLGFAAAQQPRPCTTPPQWEGRIYDSNEKQKATLRGRISYDSVYHRARIVDDLQIGSEEIANDILSLYDARIEFDYNFKTKNCTRREITEPWRDFGIRPDATSYGEAYIGSSSLTDTGLLITIWGGNFTLPNNETIPYIGTWTYRGCLPVSRTTYSEKYGNEVLSFYDLTVGISDPNVFIPRSECLTEKEYATRHTLFGTTNKKN
ncbi:unnamed protein product [Rotaria magnacalcarata]|uniref:Mammalian ependymin-related protein 1 n=1 Tax=Rotaria magnacalcarata TaxID=392030 RepID=A0A819C1R5_9BILA|nr:unnamed protein product [Rotaria magnacalcarata]CAF2218697.1 unnamed protein product [Rotaria magnacalcarata]CAF3811801.1 unnamed protein product [Rotaria magnacalcarata]CAF4368246.1 unnamed protein product [Rotaria magnacalcarata]